MGTDRSGRKPKYASKEEQKLAALRRQIWREKKAKANQTLRYVKEEILQYEWEYPIVKQIDQTV